MSDKKTLVIIGGGAAGFFCAAQIPSDLMRVVILEKGTQVLGKVKISGGGRCNVTHACFDPSELVRHYPRGTKALLGPFHHFQPSDTVEWFEARGVKLKTEEDGRMFPVTDDSQTIIDCLQEACRQNKVDVHTRTGVKSIQRDNDRWTVRLEDDRSLYADYLLFASGSAPSAWSLLGRLGHTIIDPVPSLFTFHIADHRLRDLAGLVAIHASASLEGTKHTTKGPVLITHEGLSGPAILKLSAWAARDLHRLHYDAIVRINWDTRYTKESLVEFLREWKSEHARQQVKSHSAVRLPHRLWCSLIEAAAMSETRWGDVSSKQLEALAGEVCSGFYHVRGKSTNKDEFVTAGGVKLEEVDFRTMESKRLPGVFFAGEVLDIDAVTGGFNFQAAWTTAYLAAEALKQRAGYL
ncbi:MAG: NAD(P)/FAD-dependent oxidoreductase [Flavobacteriales bacterium]|nr:NAD(P)/FAD-dependent oxidoreductase [Flavobacteriales bacterium]